MSKNILKVLSFIAIFSILGCSSNSDSDDSEEQVPSVSANFTQDAVEIFENETVNFSDNSSGNPTSWSWSFEGGQPATSTQQNPTVTYSETGSFRVTLVASNANSSDEIVKDNLIVVEDNLSNGLIGRFDLDANGLDSSPFGNNGEIVGNVVPIVNRDLELNGAMAFDGTGTAFINVENADNLNLSSNFTISVWIKPNGNVFAHDTILSKWERGEPLFNDGVGYLLAYSEEGIAFLTNLPPTQFTLTDALPINEWSHFALTFTEDKLSGYLNGNLVSEFDINGTIQSNEMRFRIGNASGSFGGTLGFNGGIDDIRIYNRLLTEAEIAELSN